MAGLKDQISKDLIQALKEKNEVKVGTLRLFLASAHNKEIEKKGKNETPELSEDETQEILRREAKKRKEAIEIYVRGGRQDLADKESGELEILEKYLPAQLAPAEVEKIILEAIAVVKPAGAKDFGKVMGEAMKKLKGLADTGEVGKIIKERLEQTV
ncbi:MAG: GatB/YqeY domain-containing protein [Minisyncoccia bacterium]